VGASVSGKIGGRNFADLIAVVYRLARSSPGVTVAEMR
jgi:hypothetical protein